MKHAHGARRPVSGTGSAGKKIAKGVASAAGAHTGRQIVKNLGKHPIVLIGMGFVAGYLVHKHRKAIISSTNKVVGKSKDFVLQQKENLEDLVAETQEPGEDSAEG